MTIMAGINSEFESSFVFVMLAVVLDVVLFAEVAELSDDVTSLGCELPPEEGLDDCELPPESDFPLDWEPLPPEEDEESSPNVADDPEPELDWETSEVVTSSGPWPPSWPGCANTIPEAEMIKINVNNIHNIFLFILSPENKKIKK